MSALFTPLKLGNVTISNRLGMSALTRNCSSNTVPNEIMKQYYEQHALGGAGLIVTEGTLITRQGTEWQDAPGIWNKEQIEGWKRITDSVHAAGSKIYSQLWHGRTQNFNQPKPVYGPSAIVARGGKFHFLDGTPGYVTAAINVKEARFDGVEHGDPQFMAPTPTLSTSSSTPHPTSAPMNGEEVWKIVHAFALDALKALIEVYGPDVALKLSPAGGYNDMGMSLQETIDTFGYLLHEVNKLRLSYIALVCYSAIDPEFEDEKPATPHDVVETYSQFLPNTHIFINEGVSPDEAEEIVSTGKAAGIFIGTNWIAHPDLGKCIQAGKEFNNIQDDTTFYVIAGSNPAIGYTDYKEAVY
ncbi:hypothetical protein DFH07DRAFT_1038180 [Mycena maculata]|uniref:NADH:flavin oxidoreductase/NADH oxidase N-terminal domain-containing protein n=1 Tax=Mycena maculata TaxID=230809 RepID=A0AAD7N5H7_9AGAR|nr:hypothetical protein DFH07DRAFT_1038180 [Mycena maculata]